MSSDHTASDPRDQFPGSAAWAQRTARQAAAFDSIGERYDEVFPHKDGQVEGVRRLLDELRPDAHVLDLGSGTGVPTARQLAQAGVRVTGYEISDRMLELARQNVPEATFVKADLMDLQPAESAYDAIVAYFSLLCLPRAQFPLALSRIRASLGPGGLLCLSMVEADLDDAPVQLVGEELRVTGYPRHELRRILAESGLVVEDERVVHYTPQEGDPETQLFLSCRRGP